ncbi:MAG: hypothetical protein II809_02270, partial [Bacteroidales bacterium]|nr:hypothetical protein [Bacteroidales bacterium]
IVVSNTCSVTASNLVLDVSSCDGLSALRIENGAAVALTLEGTNVFQSGDTAAGIRVGPGQTLNIDGTGSLEVTGSNGSFSQGGAGIGGNHGEAGGTIRISGGTVQARTSGSAAGIGGGIGGGLYFNEKYHQTGDKKFATYRTLCYAGAALTFWGQMLDGVACLPDSRTPDPGKAAVFSALLPGLGQAYVGDWWHIPIWYGGLGVCAYTLHLNQMQYNRYKYIYMLASDKDSGYSGHINVTQATTYKDLYHRYRDYSVVATILVYALNIIDANVFAYMKDFNVSDDLSLNVEPALIENLDNYYLPSPSVPSFGINMSLKF